MNELKLLGSLKPTKSDIKIAADMLIKSVDEGLENPLELAIKIKVWEELMKEAKERLMKYSLDEIDKHGGKASFSDVKVERVEGGTKYDYSADNTWSLIKMQVDYVNERLKAREEFLKKIPQGTTLVDDNTGEAVASPTKTSTTTIKITLGK